MSYKIQFGKMGFFNRLIWYKLTLFLIFILLSGAPFKLLHRTADTGLVNLIGGILMIGIYLSLASDLKKVKMKVGLCFLSATLILFSILRPIFLNPPQFKLYDLWFLFFGLFILLKPSMLRELLWFNLIFLLPSALAILFFSNLSILVLFLLLIIGFLLAIFIPESDYKLKWGIKTVLIFLISIACLNLLFLQFLIADKGVEKKGLVLFDIGHGSIESPTGIYSTDLEKSVFTGHGNLVQSLREEGYKVDFTSESLTEDVLKKTDILVLIVCSKLYDNQELRNMARFVREGGGLLVIGEHTNLQNNMSVFNPLIQKFGIKINFDTVWLYNKWRGYVHYANHPILYRLKRVYLSHGASLSLFSSAKPLLTASYSNYSDEGNKQAPEKSYLGNEKLDIKEQVGDIILAATSCSGKGRILVLGDSSYFQNPALYDNNYGFAYQVFNWLNRKNSSLPKYWIGFFILLPILILIPYRKKIPFFLFYSLPFSLMIAIFVSAQMNASSYPVFKAESLNMKVLFDLAHQNEYLSYDFTGRQPGYVKTKGIGYGINSLIQQAIRIGAHPFIKERGKINYQELSEYKACVIVVPNKPYTSCEIESLKKYVRRGGGLLVVDGPSILGWRVTDPILASFGLSQKKKPIGMNKPIYNSGDIVLRIPFDKFKARFKPCFLTEGVKKIRFINPSQVIGGEPIAWIYDKEVMASLFYDKGRVVIVGDGHFFLDSVLEVQAKTIDPDKLRLSWNILNFLMGEKIR